MSLTPKSAWGWVKVLLHSIYDQPDSAFTAFFKAVWRQIWSNNPQEG